MFSNDAIIEVLSNNFVTVIGNDGKQRQRHDSETDFFEKVTDQYWLKIHPEIPYRKKTRQGTYIMTSDGQLLGYSQDYGSPKKFLRQINSALEKWKQLPDSQSRPGAVRVGKPARVFRRLPKLPQNGLVIFVASRALDQGPNGRMEHVRNNHFQYTASRDSLWLNEKEWNTFVPRKPRKGMKFPLNGSVFQKIVRCNLRDNTFGIGKLWKKKHIKKASATLRVTAVSKRKISMRLDGYAVLNSIDDPWIDENKHQSYDVKLGGFIEYDVRAKKIVRFDVVAIGEHYAKTVHVGRTGSHPLGIVFEIGEGDPKRIVQIPIGLAHGRGTYYARSNNPKRKPKRKRRRR